MSHLIVSHAPARNSGVHTLVQYASRRDDGTVANHRVRVWVVDDQASFRMAGAATVAAVDGFVLAGQHETGERRSNRCAAYLHEVRLGPDVLSRIWRAEG